MTYGGSTATPDSPWAPPAGNSKEGNAVLQHHISNMSNQAMSIAAHGLGMQFSEEQHVVRQALVTCLLVPASKHAIPCTVSYR